jgi:hypothetical protein
MQLGASFDGVVGYFAHPVLIRGRLAANQGFADFMMQLHRTVEAALEHQAYPYALMTSEPFAPGAAVAQAFCEVWFSMARMKAAMSARGWLDQVEGAATGTIRLTFEDLTCEIVSFPKRASDRTYPWKYLTSDRTWAGC